MINGEARLLLQMEEPALVAGLIPDGRLHTLEGLLEIVELAALLPGQDHRRPEQDVHIEVTAESRLEHPQVDQRWWTAIPPKIPGPACGVGSCWPW